MASEKLNTKPEEERFSIDFALNENNSICEQQRCSQVVQYKENSQDGLYEGETFIKQNIAIPTTNREFQCPRDRCNSAEVTHFSGDFGHKAIKIYRKVQGFFGSEESRVEEKETIFHKAATPKAKFRINCQQPLTNSRGRQKTGHLFCGVTKALSYFSFTPIISSHDSFLKSLVNNEEYEKIKDETERFSEDAIRYVLTTKLWRNTKLIQQYSPLNDPLAKSVRKLVEQMITIYRTSFEVSVQKLDISANNICDVFKAVTDDVFEGNNNLITWSRLIALLSFGAQMTLHLYENGMEELASDTVNFIGTHLGERVTPWIQKQGGWINFYKSFPRENQVDIAFIKTFSKTVGILVIAATILYKFLF